MDYQDIIDTAAQQIRDMRSSGTEPVEIVIGRDEEQTLLEHYHNREGSDGRPINLDNISRRTFGLRLVVEGDSGLTIRAEA